MQNGNRTYAVKALESLSDLVAAQRLALSIPGIYQMYRHENCQRKMNKMRGESRLDERLSSAHVHGCH